MSAGRDLAALLIRATGVHLLVRSLLGRGKATILLYHDPRPEVLSRHLRYLARRYSFVSLDALTGALDRGDLGGLPKRPLVITFDDGWRGNLELLDLFREYEIRPTVFLCSQIVDTSRRFWFGVAGGPGREAFLGLASETRRALLRDAFGFEQTREYTEREPEALSLGEIGRMAELVDFQSHTRFHPVLTQCSDLECWEEIHAARLEVERITRRPCIHFSYPHGDWTEREIGMLERAGYRSARTIDLGWNGPDASPFRLKCQTITDDASVSLLAIQLAGIPAYVRRLLGGQWRGRWKPSLRFDFVIGSRGEFRT